MNWFLPFKLKFTNTNIGTQFSFRTKYFYSEGILRRQPIVVSDISLYICFQDLISESNPKNIWMRGEQACLILLDQKQLWEALIDKELSDKWNLAGSSSPRQVVLGQSSNRNFWFSGSAIRKSIKHQSTGLYWPLN